MSRFRGVCNAQAEILPSEPDLVHTSVGKSKMTSFKCFYARIVAIPKVLLYTKPKRNGIKNQQPTQTVRSK